MSSKILSFICHVPTMSAGAHSAATATSSRKAAPRKAETPKAGGHFAAIYENERFVRFKYMHNN
ncbi:hypothetical protein [Hymenobacter psychrophilus]|uniref:Uncharacterized protein n=1 Tax=Hymenobacter psychrophilus TaxID=651662 RepID=A0A1H3GQJ4_9BACT|nr:hypothetical protein [Hymenobacter psychrophilus]SDY04744.1 hypothetical protein SAMN04488069_105102 [Hymenobacter psychrophilus]